MTVRCQIKWKVNGMKRTHQLHKLIKLTGDRAKLDAKANDTYIVYKTGNGQIVKEYVDGKIVPVADRDQRMSETGPTMYVFAGNNGSGKSTIRNLIVDQLGISVNIDPDSLARAINPEHPELHRVSAGKEAIKLARDCIRNKRDFSVETTLAGGNVIRLMKDAKANGFDVTMFYVGLGDYRLNIERVEVRVRNGGHHIPAEDIIRRHNTSIRNLLNHMSLIDYLIVIDNSDSTGKIVMEVDNLQISYRSDSMPEWVVELEQFIRTNT